MAPRQSGDQTKAQEGKGSQKPFTIIPAQCVCELFYRSSYGVKDLGYFGPVTDTVWCLSVTLCVWWQGSETTIFPCERWLAKSEDDGETVRELVPSDIITEKLLRDGKLKQTETEVEDALESMLILISEVNYKLTTKQANHFSLSKGSVKYAHEEVTSKI